MHETWFISDTHFGHKNVLQYEADARLFKTVEEMNDHLITCWNSVVGDKDIIYHLGDFCFGQHNIDIAGQLKGKKYLVMGNHDCYPAGAYLKYFDKLYGVKFWHECILTHVPVHPQHARNMLNVHGHLHSKRVMWNNTAIITEQETGIIIVPPQYNENYFNVSCEQNNLTPINGDIIRAHARELL